MLTHNFYQYFSVFAERFSTETSTITAELVDYNGAPFTKEYEYNTNMPRSLLGGMISPRCSTMGIEGAWFGKSSAPPRITDYTLNEPYTKGELTAYANTLPTGTHTDEFYSVSTAYTITNNTSADLTIAEVGIFARHVSSGDHFCLLDRTVLETPIVIPPKETVSVEYVIKFPYGV